MRCDDYGQNVNRFVKLPPDAVSGALESCRKDNGLPDLWMTSLMNSYRKPSNRILRMLASRTDDA
jgi:hypothetical protein